MSAARDEELRFAVDIAQAAGRATLARFGQPLAVEKKADGSPVSEADREAESLLRARIEERFPHDGLLGEEQGLTRGEARRRWILDPIDGTKSFVRGVPLYAVLVGLVEDGEPVLGVAHFPALGETIAARAGGPALWNGQVARVSPVARWSEATLLVTDFGAVERALGTERWARLSEGAGLVRSWGDAYGHLLVATGRAEVMLDVRLKPWDALPLLPIVRAAGGAVHDWSGRPDPHEGDAVATNAALRDEALRRLAGARGAA